LAAVKAVAGTADKPCEHCGNECCSEKVTEELAKMAYERDKEDLECCWYEPSERVRKAAEREAEKCCKGGPLPVEYEEDEGDRRIEDPKPKDPESNGPAPRDPESEKSVSAAPDPVELVYLDPAPSPEGDEPRRIDDVLPRSHRLVSRSGSPTVAAALLDKPAVAHRPGSMDKPKVAFRRVVAERVVPARRPAPVSRSRTKLPVKRRPSEKSPRGVVAHISSAVGTVLVKFSGSHRPPAGTRLKVYHQYMLARSHIGDLEVITTGSKYVTTRPVGGLKFSKIGLGDTVVQR